MEKDQKKYKKKDYNKDGKYSLPLYSIMLSIFFFFCNTSHAEEISIPTVNQVGAQSMPEVIVPVEGVPFEVPEFKRPVFPDLKIDITKEGAKADKPITDVVNEVLETDRFRY